MDSEDIFRKLTVGAKFDFKRFSNDAVKLKKEKDETLEKAQENVDEVHITPKSEDRVSDEELTLLGTMKAFGEGVVKRKKRKLDKKEVTEEKRAQQEEEQVRHFRNLNRISVIGSAVPPPVDSFQKLQEDFNISPTLLQNVLASGYTEPTPIQMQAIPIMLQDRQIFACAPTGSGKTAAFLIPIIHQLKKPMKLGFRAVIVSPTRELASQTYRECVRLSEGTGLRCHIINKTKQAANKFGPQSSQKFDILVTTPNRLVYLLQEDPPSLSLNNIKWCIHQFAHFLLE
ncbi:hypothetical protein L9F63_016821, partial [Diploptera punctata]